MGLIFSGFSYETLSPSPSSDIYSWRSGGRSPTPSPPLSEGGSGSSIWGQNTTDEGIVIDEFDDIPRKKRVSRFMSVSCLMDGRCLYLVRTRWSDHISTNTLLTCQSPSVRSVRNQSPFQIGEATDDVWPKLSTNIRPESQGRRFPCHFSMSRHLRKEREGGCVG